MSTFTLATEQPTPTRKTIARGRHKFIAFPGETQKALFSYTLGGSSHQCLDVNGSTKRIPENYHSVRIFTITAPRTALVPLPESGDQKKWLNIFTERTCKNCSHLAQPALAVQSAFLADRNIINLKIDALERVVARYQTGTCKGVQAHQTGICPASHNIAEGLSSLDTAVMQVPALCLMSTYTSQTDLLAFSEREYNLFAYRETDQKVGPYCPANVYSSGKICWGIQMGNSNVKPRTPKEALSMYWGSGFNQDLASQRGSSLKTTLENYRQTETSYGKLQNYLHEHKYGTSQPCVGIYLSSYRNLLQKVPAEHHIKLGEETMVLAWVLYAEPEKYVLDCNGFLVEMSKLNGSSTVNILNLTES
jgi:hypothetical protein